MDAQAGKSPVAVGLDRGHTQAQIAGNAVLRHAHQESGTDIKLARGEMFVQMLQLSLSTPDVMFTRHRPLCAYPAVATYVGNGSIEDAANFSCR